MTNAEARFNKSHIRKVYACLAVTCHLHFWQNDRDFLRATVVTRGWNGYRNKSQHRKSTLEKKIHESGALTTELSPPRPLLAPSPFLFMSSRSHPSQNVAHSHCLMASSFLAFPKVDRLTQQPKALHHPAPPFSTHLPITPFPVCVLCGRVPNLRPCLHVDRNSC